MADTPGDGHAAGMVAFLSTILGSLRRIEKILCVVAFTVLIGVVFADVVSRELTGAGLYWAAQTGVWANVIVVMAGFGLASAGGMHLRPRFADRCLPAGWAGVLETLQYLCMAMFCLALALLAAGVVVGSWQLGEVAIDLFLPVWPVQAALPLAFLVAALRYGIYAWVPALRPVEISALVPQDTNRSAPGHAAAVKAKVAKDNPPAAGGGAA